jgi:hypothetical protein
MTRIWYLILFFIAIVMMTGSAAAEQTTITAPSAAIYNATSLPFNISGLSGSPGLEFELRYNSSVLAVTGVAAAPAFRGSNVIQNVNNDAGTAKILMISTNGITAAYPSSVILVTFTVKGTGYTPIQVQNAKWVSANFNSVAFDTVTNGLVTTNGATVPVAAVFTTIPPPPPTTATPVHPQANPTELPTLDLPTPSGPSAPAVEESPATPVITTAPLPERTMVLFSPTEAGAGVPTPNETATVAVTPAQTISALPVLTAEPAETQRSPGFSFIIALAASGLAAVAVLCSRRV